MSVLTHFRWPECRSSGLLAALLRTETDYAFRPLRNPRKGFNELFVVGRNCAVDDLRTQRVVAQSEYRIRDFILKDLKILIPKGNYRIKGPRHQVAIVVKAGERERHLPQFPIAGIKSQVQRCLASGRGIGLGPSEKRFIP